MAFPFLKTPQITIENRELTYSERNTIVFLDITIGLQNRSFKKGQLQDCPCFELQFHVCPYFFNFARLPLLFQIEGTVCPSFLSP